MGEAREVGDRDNRAAAMNIDDAAFGRAHVCPGEALVEDPKAGVCQPRRMEGYLPVRVDSAVAVAQENSLALTTFTHA